MVLLEAIINGVYVDPPVAGGRYVDPNNPSSPLKHPRVHGALLGPEGWIRVSVFGWVGSAAAAQLCLVLLKIGVFLAVGCALHRRGYFWKI